MTVSEAKSSILDPERGCLEEMGARSAIEMGGEQASNRGQDDRVVGDEYVNVRRTIGVKMSREVFGEATGGCHRCGEACPRFITGRKMLHHLVVAASTPMCERSRFVDDEDAGGTEKRVLGPPLRRARAGGQCLCGLPAAQKRARVQLAEAAMESRSEVLGLLATGFRQAKREANIVGGERGALPVAEE